MNLSMIEDLLRNILPLEYGITRTNINLTVRTASGEFEEGDAKACTDCKKKFPGRAACNEQVMKVDAGEHTITIVEHEAYLNQFNGRAMANGGRCDLILFNEDSISKIVFCDMGCCMERYEASKRAKARKQTTDSIKRFHNKESGRNFIKRFTDKQLVFFRRDSALTTQPLGPVRGNVNRNTQVFIKTPISTSTYVESKEYIDDIQVDFVIINYPNAYRW